jgi:transcriptional regulator with XRE-family HTH domain
VTRPDHNEAYLAQLGHHLKVLRVKAGLTQEQLAERAGLHRTFIGRLERGESGINVERLPDLAGALGVEPSELIPPTDRPSRATLAASNGHAVRPPG